MVQESLQSFAAARGYKAIEDGMVGSYRSYPFVTRLKTGSISVLTTIITITGRLPNRLGRQIRKQLPKRCGLTWNGPVTLVCSGRDDGLLENFTMAMDIVTEALRENNLSVNDQCPYCKTGGCDVLALTGTAYHPAHRTCCQERSYAAATSAEMNARQGSYFTGIIGAVLGGVIATLPSVLTIWFMERIYAVLFFLIPLGCYYGYRLLRGRMSKAVGVITIVLSLLMPFVLEQFIFYLAVATTYHIMPSILATTALYFQMNAVSDMIVSMLMPYIFLIIGLFVTFRQITHTAENDVADASAVLDSITPYGAAASYIAPEE